MNVIHLFNPQNDLALANGSPYFTPPKAATELATSGACLPMWYASPGDRFFGAVNDEWFTRISVAFGLAVEPGVRPRPGFAVEPWGWSPAVLHDFAEMGVDRDTLPSGEVVGEWRNLSSRVASTPVLTALMEAVPSIVDHRPDAFAPQIATSIDEALDTIGRFGRAMIKLPWSNSGRGQQDTARTTPDELRRRLSGMIDRHGAVEIAPYYNRIADFAMLFDHNRFIGYSLFDTDTHGGWTGNIIIPDEEIERRISLSAGADIEFRALRQTLEKLLPDQQACRQPYVGPTGVDFIVARTADGTTVIPPVEINRRRTMGHLAHALATRILAPGVTGRFTITPRNGNSSRTAADDDYAVADRRMTRGSLSLVPPGSSFDIRLTADAK